MKIVALDDERIALENIVAKLNKIEYVTSVVGFRKVDEALEYLQEHEVDVIFLDINVRNVDGITLAKNLQEQYPSLHIIFQTGYSEYAVDAFALHVDGYLLKPVKIEEIRAELDRIRKISNSKRRIKVQTFGNFEVFCDGQPIHFRYKKTKELFAYLIDRTGAEISNTEIAVILWEDKEDSSTLRSQTRNLVADLAKTFRNLGVENIVIKKRNAMAVDCSLIDCDYIRLREGDETAIRSYNGEYMRQYSWAETTTAFLTKYIK